MRALTNWIGHNLCCFFFFFNGKRDDVKMVRVRVNGVTQSRCFIETIERVTWMCVYLVYLVGQFHCTHRIRLFVCFLSSIHRRALYCVVLKRETISSCATIFIKWNYSSNSKLNWLAALRQRNCLHTRIKHFFRSLFGCRSFGRRLFLDLLMEWSDDCNLFTIIRCVKFGDSIRMHLNASSNDRRYSVIYWVYWEMKTVADELLIHSIHSIAMSSDRRNKRLI